MVATVNLGSVLTRLWIKKSTYLLLLILFERTKGGQERLEAGTRCENQEVEGSLPNLSFYVLKLVSQVSEPRTPKQSWVIKWGPTDVCGFNVIELSEFLHLFLFWFGWSSAEGWRGDKPRFVSKQSWAEVAFVASKKQWETVACDGGVDCAGVSRSTRAEWGRVTTM